MQKGNPMNAIKKALQSAGLQIEAKHGREEAIRFLMSQPWASVDDVWTAAGFYGVWQ